jgi:hypothetical protein
MVEITPGGGLRFEGVFGLCAFMVMAFCVTALVNAALAGDLGGGPRPAALSWLSAKSSRAR